MKKKTTAAKPLVGVIMGSDSDWPTMKAASEALDEFGIEHEVAVVSAHRMPTEMVKYGQTAHKRGIRVVIAGAGGAAHLPGMVASLTPLPVIGVPVESRALKGMDSLLSIVQMPGGVPVATVAIGGGRNAGLLAVEILGASDPKLQERILQFKKELCAAAKQRGKNLQKTLKETQA
jgi:5-(carboxyamino)imidazole ribonucleotide mutase